MSVLVCTCFGCTCICVHALYVHPHVYLVYMLAICSLLVTQILYNSIVCIFLYSSDSATSVHHSPPHTPQRTAGWCHVYINTFVYIILYVYTVSATAILCLSRVHSVVCTFPCLTLGPFQMSRQLLAHQKQKYNLQVGICLQYIL